MATAVYLLSALISIACVVLLARSFLATHSSLLLWAAICFAGLALNNVLLFVDEILVTEVDLSTWRAIPALAGLLVLMFGLLWEPEQ